MRCGDCDLAFDGGDRYCSKCGTYLAVEPGPAKRELLQLSQADFLTTVGSGLPLIWENVSRLWTEAVEISKLGARRSVCILQGFAEEEAAKALILLDAMRCPASFTDKFSNLVKQIDLHIGKGVYARYYGTSPGDLTEVKRIVDYNRQGFYREGEYGEFILPNQIKASRESMLYVSYVRNDDGTRGWYAPRGPFEFEGRIYPATIRVLEALHAVGIFEHEALQVFRDYWQEIHFVDVGIDPQTVAIETSVNWTKLTELNFKMLKRLDQLDLLSPTATIEHQNTIIHYLLFPLYPFDLNVTKNFHDLPQPESPYSY
jgi:hypothetical protein